MSYDVVVLPSARSDFVDLAERDREVARAALAVAGELRENPWLGKEMRSRLGLQELRECRRIAFDRSDWKGKPRYRLIYATSRPTAPRTSWRSWPPRSARTWAPTVAPSRA